MSFSSRTHRKLPRRFGALVLSGALVASFAGLALATPATAAHGDGTPYATNLSCAGIDPTWQEFKLEAGSNDGGPAYETGDSTHDVKSGFVITITDATDKTFNWSSAGEFELMTVLVKGGQGGGGLRYDYSPDGATEGTGLHAQDLLEGDMADLYHDISHVRFCFVAVDEPELEKNPVIENDPVVEDDTTVDVQPAIAAPAPEVVAAQPEAAKTTVLGETLVQGDTLPRTGAAATHMLALTGGLGLALGLMMLMLANRKTAAHNS